jgi:precorrin-2 dehydrogenase / sirohydrochlorin ferrochelatase
MLPVALQLRERSVLVVGAGAIGVSKAAQLIAEGAHVSVVAMEKRAPLPKGVISFSERPFECRDLEGKFLVVVAAGDPILNEEIYRAASEKNILINVVDVPQYCDFYFTAVHRNGPITVAVSSEGASPALAGWTRDICAAALPKNLGTIAQNLREERRELQQKGENQHKGYWLSRIDELLGES